MTVSTNALNIGEQGLGPVDHVLLVPEGGLEDLGVVQQHRVLDETEDLAEEGNRLLVELLGVSDIGEDDAVEGEGLVALSQTLAVFLRLDGQLTAHGVLGRPDVRVDVVDAEAFAVGRLGLSGQSPLGIGNAGLSHGGH